MMKLETLARKVVTDFEKGGYISQVVLDLSEHLDSITQERLAHEGTIEAARSNYADDDINIDDEPLLSVADEGVWVQAWVWVPIEGTDEDEDEA